MEASLSCSKSKLGQGRFRLGIRKKFFAQMVAGHWNRLLREVISILSLMEFKECLDNDLRHNVVFLGCPGGQELVWVITMGRFQLRTFHGSMNSFLFVIFLHHEFSLEHIPSSTGPSHGQQHPQKLRGQKSKHCLLLATVNYPFINDFPLSAGQALHLDFGDLVHPERSFISAWSQIPTAPG